jgi:hypothetical protein
MGERRKILSLARVMGGNMVNFGAIFYLVFYLFFDHVTPVTLAREGNSKNPTVRGNKPPLGISI